jgi:hypothetical protein
VIELLFVITGISLVGGTAAAAIAWRTTRENRRRSAARIARLSEVIYAAEPREGAAVPTAHLLDSIDAEAESPKRRVIPGVLAVTAVLVAIAVTLAASRSAALPQRSADLPPKPEPSMLELVSLVHERGSAGQLELRGEVHNPENGATLEEVTAVAMLFDGQGAYLASGRAPLETRTLAHGADATFSISIPDAAAAERYRVSFRTRDRIIPHTDRRRDH